MPKNLEGGMQPSEGKKEEPRFRFDDLKEETKGKARQMYKQEYLDSEDFAKTYGVFYRQEEMLDEAGLSSNTRKYSPSAYPDRELLGWETDKASVTLQDGSVAQLKYFRKQCVDHSASCAGLWHDVATLEWEKDGIGIVAEVFSYTNTGAGYKEKPENWESALGRFRK